MILRCTKKLGTVIGWTHFAKAAPRPNDEDWYANLLWFDGRKCLLLTHSATLFSVFEADVHAADLRTTPSLVFRLIGRELAAEHLPHDTFFEPESQEFILAKTADRSVLGCMNDMAFLCELTVIRSGGLRATDFADLNHALRRNINRARDYHRPIELTEKRLTLRRDSRRNS